jgi:hypothetical protein
MPTTTTTPTPTSAPTSQAATPRPQNNGNDEEPNVRAMLEEEWEQNSNNNGDDDDNNNNNNNNNDNDIGLGEEGSIDTPDNSDTEEPDSEQQRRAPAMELPDPAGAMRFAPKQVDLVTFRLKKETKRCLRDLCTQAIRDVNEHKEGAEVRYALFSKLALAIYTEGSFSYDKQQEVTLNRIRRMIDGDYLTVYNEVKSVWGAHQLQGKKTQKDDNLWRAQTAMKLVKDNRVADAFKVLTNQPKADPRDQNVQAQLDKKIAKKRDDPPQTTEEERNEGATNTNIHAGNDDVREAVRKIARGKSPGPSLIPPDTLKILIGLEDNREEKAKIETMITELTTLINSMRRPPMRCEKS